MYEPLHLNHNNRFIYKLLSPYGPMCFWSSVWAQRGFVIFRLYAVKVKARESYYFSTPIFSTNAVQEWILLQFSYLDKVLITLVGVLQLYVRYLLFANFGRFSAEVWKFVIVDSLLKWELWVSDHQSHFCRRKSTDFTITSYPPWPFFTVMDLRHAPIALAKYAVALIFY